jgi:hypothetical protein
MLENIREQASFTPEEEPLDPNAPKPPNPRKPRRSLDQVTGMSAGQRFAVALMIAVIVVLVGIMSLLFSGNIVLPFL